MVLGFCEIIAEYPAIYGGVFCGVGL